METFLETRDYAVSGEVFCLKHDAHLDMLITEPRPDDITRYYQSNSYISHTDSFETLSDRLYHLVKKYMLWKKCRLMERYTKGAGKVLDIGSGTGDFLRMARKRKWSIAGVEPNPMARGLANEKQVPLYRDIQEVEGYDYDAVTLWHTLEHLPDLDAYITRFKQHLTSDGVILVAVPNFKSLDARIYKEFWAAYDVPRHLWHFSQSAIKEIFERHGLQIQKRIPLYFDAYYIALLSEQYKNGKNRYLRAFWNGLRSNLAALSSSEYSSLLYVIKRA